MNVTPLREPEGAVFSYAKCEFGPFTLKLFLGA